MGVLDRYLDEQLFRGRAYFSREEGLRALSLSPNPVEHGVGMLIHGPQQAVLVFLGQAPIAACARCWAASEVSTVRMFRNEPRRHFSAQYKRELVERVLASPLLLARVAREHELNQSARMQPSYRRRFA